MSEAVDIDFYIAIIFNMRFISLFLVLNIVLCYSGVCLATVVPQEADQISSHCDMVDHGTQDSSNESQIVIQDANSDDSESSQCCYEGLTNSLVLDNIGYKSLEVLYITDLPSSLETNNSRLIDLIFTKSIHDPPDIYLSVSSFLL